MTQTVMVPEISEALDSDWAGRIDGVVLDMDGVLYRGDTVIPEVPAFIETLNDRGIRFTMATNNSTNTQAQYVAKLARMGITVTEDQVVTAGVATATALRQKYARGTSVFVVGMQALRDALFDDGYFVEGGIDCELVVSGANFELRYEDLKDACLAIRAGADYVATNADRTFPTEAGLIPGSGAIVAALTAATDVAPTVIGKPSPEMIASCLEIMQVPADRALMIGDRLDTDILAGERAGVPTLLVLTGVSTQDEARATGIVPDTIIPTLAPLTAAFAATARRQ